MLFNLHGFVAFVAGKFNHQRRYNIYLYVKKNKQILYDTNLLVDQSRVLLGNGSCFYFGEERKPYNLLFS